jgi:hypothetical protein
MNTLAPILLFVYNRPQHTQQAVEALQKNTLAKDSELFIFSDAPKNEQAKEKVTEVRKYIAGISGFEKVNVVENKENWGCDVSEQKFVSKIIAEYGKVIVIEDDIVTVPLFLEYMNNALNVFELDEKIWSISGYKPPFKIRAGYKEDIFLSSRLSSWGWGTWKNRWEKIDWDKTGAEKILTDTQLKKSFCKAGEDLMGTLIKYPEAWDIISYYTQWQQGTYTVYPVYSLVKNIGTDGTGVHFTLKQTKYKVALHNVEIKINPDIRPDEKILAAMKKFYTKPWYRKCMVWATKKIGVYNFLEKKFG